MTLRSFRAALIAGLLAALLAQAAAAAVWYEKGRRTINGVVLLQDTEDASKYYYVPPYPRLAQGPEGNFEFVAVKFVDPEGDTSGGLIHFLVQFDLLPEEVQALQDELQKVAPGAEIMGPVPMSEIRGEKGQPVESSFRLVSAVMADEGGMTRTMVSSGHAPLTPGSKAAIAAILEPAGATLLWSTLDGPTSDLSVAISGQYEAVVEAFNGRIYARMDTIYEHFSQVVNRQSGYKKRELRSIVDEMMREGVIEVEVFDRSEGLGVDAGAMQRVIDLCTDKIVALMFDTETGLSRLPEREQAVEKGQIRRRQERGAFVKFFAGEGNPEYITDDQFVMKSREDISRNVFSIVLSANTSIRIPFHTSGNIRGFYETHGDDPDLFRIVNLADPAFQMREIHFTIDRDYVSAFTDTINFVTINFRKHHGDGRPDTTKELQFTHEDVAEGNVTRFLTYPRLGAEGSDWLDYEYRLSWSIFGKDTVTMPAGDDEWLSSADAVVSLLPPFDKTEVELEADRAEFEDRHLQSGVVEIRYRLMGETRSSRQAVLRGADQEPSNSFVIYHDTGTVPEMRLTWYGRRGSGRQVEDWQPIDATYVFLELPEFSVPEEEEAEEEPAEEPEP